MSGRSALKASDERKRPRQSNFSSLSSGLIERGRVPAEVLYGRDADKAERAAAEPAIAATAEAPEAPEAPRAEPLEPFEARVLRPQIPDDKAEAERLAAEERTRPLELTFGTLTEDMLERGKLPRHVLTKEQIDLLLTPQKVAPEVLHQTGDAAEQHEGDDHPPVAPAEAEPIAVAAVDDVEPLLPEPGASLGSEDRAITDVAVEAVAAADEPVLLAEPSPPLDAPEVEAVEVAEPEIEAAVVVAAPEVTAPESETAAVEVAAVEVAAVETAEPVLAEPESGSDTLDREPQADSVPTGDLMERTPRVPYDPTLPIVRPTDPAPAAATPIASTARKPAKVARIALWAASLFVAVIGGWALLRTPAPPVAPQADSTPAAVTQIAEPVAPAPAPAEVATTEPARAASPEPQVTPAPAAETPAVETATDAAPAPSRQRPGAVPYDPPAVALTAPSEPPSPPAPAPAPAAPQATAELPKPAVAPTEPAPAVAPTPTEPVSPPAAQADAEPTADLLQRGDEHLLRGDIATARLFYERAAEAGDVQAMIALAQTYDPQVLRKLGARGIRPEPELAQRWYAKAAEAQAKTGRQ